MIRPFRDSDLPILCDIARRAYKGIFDGFERQMGRDALDVWIPDAWNSKDAQLALKAKTEPGMIAVCERNGSIVGFVTYRINAATGIGNIGNNASDPQCGEKGVGQEMYEYVLGEFKKAGMKMAMVHTGLDAAHARARKAYERAGFDRRIPEVLYFKMLEASFSVPQLELSAELILASASPRRRMLLEKAGLRFQVLTQETREISIPGDGEGTATGNAAAKAAAVFAELKGMGEACGKIVLGADTVVELDGRILGKPENDEAAQRMLMSLSGRTHRVVTGVSLISEHREVRFCVTTSVTFRSFDAETAREYRAKVHCLDKAGAYGAQEHGDMLIERIDGSLDNVIGLPVQEVLGELKAWRCS